MIEKFDRKSKNNKNFVWKCFSQWKPQRMRTRRVSHLPVAKGTKQWTPRLQSTINFVLKICDFYWKIFLVNVHFKITDKSRVFFSNKPNIWCCSYQAYSWIIGDTKVAIHTFANNKFRSPIFLFSKHYLLSRWISIITLWTHLWPGGGALS